MTVNGIALSPVQETLYRTLSDGVWHTRKELVRAVHGHDGGNEISIKIILHRLRKRGLPIEGKQGKGYRLAG